MSAWCVAVDGHGRPGAASHRTRSRLLQRGFQASSVCSSRPGTNFLWHEITLTLDPKSNYRQVEQRMMEAGNKVFAEYAKNGDAEAQR
jgi:hypothetical protein